VGERVAEAVEDVFGFEVPEGLELEPFGNVGLEGLDFELDEGEGPLEGVVLEVCELDDRTSVIYPLVEKENKAHTREV
jgi:hypothetical protein